MAQQFIVICHTFYTAVWPIELTDTDELSRVDAQYSVDGEKYQYQYRRGENAELGKNWRERCAAEAHYHAKNNGSVVRGIVLEDKPRKRAKSVDERQIALPFDDVETLSGIGEGYDSNE